MTKVELARKLCFSPDPSSPEQECVIYIPFLCQKCGKCCREIDGNWNGRAVHRVADYLNMKQRDFIEKYLGVITRDKDDSSQYKILDEKTIPCPFLTPENECEIYSVRPVGCAKFPLKTDFTSIHTIDCPGLQRMKKIEKEFKKKSPLWSTSPISISHIEYDLFSSQKPQCLEDVQMKLPEGGERERVWRKFLHTNPPRRKK